MLSLKIEIIIIIISYETFYLYYADNDVLWSFFQLQNKWITRNLKEGGYIALNTGTNTSMLCLKFDINLIIISYKTFYLCHEDNDVLLSFFQKQNKLRTRKLNEGGYWALNPDIYTSLLHLKSKVCFIHNSSMSFYLYHIDNGVLWSFFQVQNNWTPRKLKQGRYEALNPDTNTSMFCLNIEIHLFFISYKIFYLYHKDNDVLGSFFQIKQMEN